MQKKRKKRKKEEKKKERKKEERKKKIPSLSHKCKIILGLWGNRASGGSHNVVVCVVLIVFLHYLFIIFVVVFCELERIGLDKGRKTGNKIKKKNLSEKPNECVLIQILYRLSH